MRPFRLTTSAIMVFSLILVSSFIFLVIRFYQTALTEAISYHQQLQSEMAKSATTSINFYLEHLGNDLELMAQLESEDLEPLLQTNLFKAEGVNSWFTTNANLHVDYSWGDTLSDWVGDGLKEVQQNTIHITPSVQPESYLQFSRVFPANTEETEGPFEFLVIYAPDGTPTVDHGDWQSNKNIGVIVSFDWLMDKFVTPLKLGDDDFAWVIDKTGTLIYHPVHSEMLLHNINELEKDCVECHSSFKTQERMIKEGTGKAEYLIEGEPKKIMAYSPIENNNLKWVLAISSYSPSVVQDVLKNSMAIFLLSGVILVLLIFTGGSLYYLNLKRIRADEAQNHYTQIQRMQDKLDQADKLASLGELIDSVAHEINTPTGIISVISDGLLLENFADEDTPKDLLVIKKQVQRIKQYTKRLLGYSRVMPFTPEQNNILDLIEECLFLVGPRLREKEVNVETELSASMPDFIFDRPRLEQVIINLLNNAIDFVELKGWIKIRLKTEDEQTPEGQKSWNILSVQDNGFGIPSVDIPHIFEPFFSKKPTANGTGLGLSISKTIIERHGGRLEVNSEPGKGATFSIYLPLEKS